MCRVERNDGRKRERGVWTNEKEEWALFVLFFLDLLLLLFTSSLSFPALHSTEVTYTVKETHRSFFVPQDK